MPWVFKGRHRVGVANIGDVWRPTATVTPINAAGRLFLYLAFKFYACHRVKQPASYENIDLAVCSCSNLHVMTEPSLVVLCHCLFQVMVRILVRFSQFATN